MCPQKTDFLRDAYLSPFPAGLPSWQNWLPDQWNGEMKFPIQRLLSKNPFIVAGYSCALLLLNLVPTVTVVTDVLLDKVRMGALKNRKSAACQKNLNNFCACMERPGQLNQHQTRQQWEERTECLSWGKCNWIQCIETSKRSSDAPCWWLLATVLNRTLTSKRSFSYVTSMTKSPVYDVCGKSPV